MTNAAMLKGCALIVLRPRKRRPWTASYHHSFIAAVLLLRSVLAGALEGDNTECLMVTSHSQRGAYFRATLIVQGKDQM